MQLGNGSTRQYQFDSNSRLTTQIELNGATKICTIVDGYDSVGNRITRNLDGNPTTWTYDNLYRLTGQNKSGQVCTYQMDSVGNLEVMWEASANPKTFTFDAADKLVTMAEGTALTTYTWTGYGALEVEQLGSRRTTYTYSGQDQLIGVVSSATSTYTFDGDGLRRTAEEGNAGKVTMVWDGSDYLFLDGPSSDQLVLTLDSEIVSCGTKDLLTDPLGSLVKEISSGASLGSLIEMYPYGTLVSGTGTPTIPYVYIAKYGYYFDNEQRDYVRARELSKATGRWMQVDPLWPSASEGPHQYVRSSPIGSIDPLGHKTISPNLMPKAASDCSGIGWDSMLSCSPIPFVWETWCFACLKPLHEPSQAEIDRLPGYTERERNALRHCLGACRACYKCGCRCAGALDVREVWQWWTGRGGDKEDAGCDIYNNGMGRALGCNRALDKISCIDGCIWLLKQSRLCLDGKPPPRGGR